ncbi:aminodeoxychorismate/anthranilate synthase component II [Candidatus Vidania fulgoroideorum]
MILIIDHNDSFVNNISEMFKNLKKKIYILNYNKLNYINLFIILYKVIICLGPGPGDPREYKKSTRVLNNFYKSLKILGICLGHQIIGIFFGMNLKISKNINHGLPTNMIIKKFFKFINIPKRIKVVRYNSLTLNFKKSKNLKLEGFEEKNREIMILKHKKYNIISFQYHPDSFMSQYSKKIMKFFINEKCFKNI